MRLFLLFLRRVLVVLRPSSALLLVLLSQPKTQKAWRVDAWSLFFIYNDQ